MAAVDEDDALVRLDRPAASAAIGASATGSASASASIAASATAATSACCLLSGRRCFDRPALSLPDAVEIILRAERVTNQASSERGEGETERWQHDA